jgi:hypothetical protein
VTTSRSAADLGAAIDFESLRPPSDPRDAAAWDRYWAAHLSTGFAGVGDQMTNTDLVFRTMVTHRFRSVLCVGTGVSLEPKALAAVGLNVTALDLSPLAIRVSRGVKISNRELRAGFRLPRRPFRKGRVEWVVGDALDATTCSGPFDVVIERLTAQAQPEDLRAEFLSRLADRLAPNGLFVSHAHDGGWKPPGEPRHWCRTWFVENGWPIWDGRPGSKPAGRVAWLWTTTG